MMNWKKAESHVKGMHWWVLQDKVKSKYKFDEPVDINLILEAQKGDLEEFDFEFIDPVIKNMDNYISQAVKYIKEQAENNPELFGIEPDETDEYNSIELPVDLPSVVFYPGHNWFMRFVHADYPAVGYGQGIGVFFKEHTISEFEILPEEEGTND